MVFTLPASGTNSSEIKLQNVSAILLTLLLQGNISRVQIAQQIGVSTSTITNLVSELIEHGLVVEEGVVRPDGQNSVGRPQKSLRLVSSARYVVGVHINVGSVHLAVTNLLCEPLVSCSFEHTLSAPWSEVLEEILAKVEELIEQAHLTTDLILGVGVAASGLVDPFTGVNVISPNLNWHDVPIHSYFEEKLHLPIVVENNVRAMALGEALFGHAQGAHSIAFVYGRIGVGAGLIIGGQVYRGAAAGAGEMGHTAILLGDDDQCKVISLEQLVSEPAIIDAVRRYAESTGDAQLLGADLTLERVFALASSGHAGLIALLDKRAFYLGIALANLVNVFNPDLIVLGGLFYAHADYLLPRATATLREFAFGNLGEKIRVMTTQFGTRAGMIGASALALDRFFYRPVTHMPDALSGAIAR